jgi:hypothetical protein
MAVAQHTAGQRSIRSQEKDALAEQARREAPMIALKQMSPGEQHRAARIVNENYRLTTTLLTLQALERKH